jgi:hypothetical protein
MGRVPEGALGRTMGHTTAKSDPDARANYDVAAPVVSSRPVAPV